MLKQLSAYCSILIFAGIIVSGSVKLLDYSTRPSGSGNVASRIVQMNVLENHLDPTKQTLLLFVHPQCPCTKATVTNFCTVVDEIPQSVQCLAVAYCPDGIGDNWLQSQVMTTLNSKPTVGVIADRGSKIASEFGVNCSGHILVYSELGDLQFSGGITAGRGHEGNCLPLDDLKCVLQGDATTPTHWPVFGCSLAQRKGQQNE